MSDATSLLFDLPRFRAIECVEDQESSGRQVTVVSEVDVHGCPDCGVIVDEPHDQCDRVIKDLPTRPC